MRGSSVAQLRHNELPINSGTFATYSASKGSPSSGTPSTHITSVSTLVAMSTNPQSADDLPSKKPVRDESRRTFINQCMSALAGFTIVGAVAPILAGCEASTVAPGLGKGNDITVNVSSLDADGKALVTAQTGPDNYRIIIARQSATTYVALSMQCTHESNPVNAPVGGTITCPFHGSEFDLSGNVKKGPAGSPLRSYTTIYNDTTKSVTVKFS